MRIGLSEEDLAFRDEVRRFLDDELTAELRQAGRQTRSAFIDKKWSVAWQKILYRKGWVAPSWPVEHGGAGWNTIQRYIFASECASAEAPPLAPMGLKMCGPVLMRFGTSAQKSFYLPRILSAEDYWCQGYSEPGSGSDLASLQMRAVREGDQYVLSGSKMWTSHAHLADRMFCLVRTSAAGKPQEGITFLLIDMNAPGISVRPIITLANDHEVNQVFFDDVRIPIANRVGEENQGWAIAKYLLEFERGDAFAARLQARLRRLREIARVETGDDGGRLIDDSAFSRRIADLEIEVAAIELTEHRFMSALSAGANPGAGSSQLKVQGSEAQQRIDELTIEAVAHYAAVQQGGESAPIATNSLIGPAHALTAMPRYLNYRAATIYGGSNEIQRNIMARMVLQLP